MFDMEKSIADFTAIARELALKAYNSGVAMGEDNGSSEKECAYEDGLVKAWDCARDILTMEQEEFDSIFDEMDRWNTIKKHTPTECINAIKEYREKKDEIDMQVGDEIYLLDKDYTYIITSIVGNSIFYISKVGKFGAGDKRKFKKTGRKFPQMADMLNRMRGGEQNA